MLDRAFRAVLRIIDRRLREGVTWALTGSVGFVLQGVPVVPHDIDVQTDEPGAYEIERRFATHVLRPVTFSSTDWIRSHFGALRIEGITVEIMGGGQKRLPDGTWEDPVDVTTHRPFVEVAGISVPLLSLEYEYEAYLCLGRTETAAMLQSHLRRD